MFLTGDEPCPQDSCLGRLVGGFVWEAGEHGQAARPDTYCGLGLRVALLVSRGEQQYPVDNVSSSRSPVDGCRASSAMALPGRGRCNSPSIQIPDAWQTGALGWEWAQGPHQQSGRSAPAVWPLSTAPHILLKNSTVDTNSKGPWSSAKLGRDHEPGLLL